MMRASPALVRDRSLFVVTHPDVVIDPVVPVPLWRLSERGRERMRVAATRAWSMDVRAVFCNAETKAREAAALLADARGIAAEVIDGLGENDRSATGYLPREAFEATADAFFARPNDSVRGWERATDAQHRIVAALDRVLRCAPKDGDIAVITHGAVAALLMCALQGRAITRAADQPAGQGGFRFTVDPVARTLRQGWTAIDD